MVAVIRLVLPYPVSTNRYWRTYQPKGFRAPVTTLSEEAKAYKREVGLIARAAGVRQPLQGFVRVSMWLVPHAPQDVAKRMRAQPQTWPLGVQSLDLGNCEKVVCDALNGIAWGDDRQIEDLRIQRAPPGQKGLIVEFEEFVPAWLQAPDLFGEVAA